tara:strand:- start:221 stop:460 length:240 start_codon:yes stop_codon:yes gene_type:complete
MGFFKKWMDKLFGKQQESFANKTLDTLKKVKSKSVKKKTGKQKTEKKKVRARDAKGKFVGDDPDTPENEAWEKEFPTRE